MNVTGRSYAAGGSGIFGGLIDYMQMINARDGGINGVKVTWEKCETEYNNARGVECYERTKKRGRRERRSCTRFLPASPIRSSIKDIRPHSHRVDRLRPH